MTQKVNKVSYQPYEISNIKSFIHNFDVSVILPFYKKLEEFKTVLPKNQLFFSTQRN